MIKKTIKKYSDLTNVDETVYDKENNTLWVRNPSYGKPRFVAYTIESEQILDGYTVINPLNNTLRGLGFNSHWGIFGYGEYLVWMNNQRRPFERSLPDEKDIKTELKRLERFKEGNGYGATEIQMGVELELEGATKQPMSELLNDYIGSKKPIQDVGCDGSVYDSGTEIRFNHPKLTDWKLATVRDILRIAKKNGCETKGGSAGMHVHVSHPKVKIAIKTFKDNLELMQKILYPINCRPRKKNYKGEVRGDVSYGVGGNIYHDQGATFGTLEIRAWNATLNPRMFMARVRFSRWLVNYLTKDTHPTMAKIFKAMGTQAKRDYLYMLNSKENPHQWGEDPEKFRALLAA